ncbi:MAG: hypothetical protein V1690_01615 [Candidatus Moraniibacteriota bacterium]
MLPQIRISKTPKIKSYMDRLREELPALEDSEIIKFLIGRAIAELEKKDNENYFSLVGSSPSYGGFKDERDNDEDLYTEKNIKPLE